MLDPTRADSTAPSYGASTAGVGISSLQRAPQRSQSMHGSASADAALSLQQLDEDMGRDMRAAQDRATILQEEVESLLARVANAHDAAAVDREHATDSVFERVQAIRQARRD